MSRLGENVEFTLFYGNFHTLNVWLIIFHQFLRSNCIFSQYLDLLSWFRIIITALKAHFRGQICLFIQQSGDVKRSEIGQAHNFCILSLYFRTNTYLMILRGLNLLWMDITCAKFQNLNRVASYIMHGFLFFYCSPIHKTIEIAIFNSFNAFTPS